MTIDTQRALLETIYTKLTTDEGLMAAMGGTVRLRAVWANPDEEFPYLVQQIDFTATEFWPIRKGTLYLDIWSHSENYRECLEIRRLVIGLLDEWQFDTANDEAVNCKLWLQTDGMIEEDAINIWHYATQWNLRMYRKAEVAAIG